MAEQHDRIHVHGLEVLARVGVTANERAAPQRLVVDVTVAPRSTFATMGDEIMQTANYSAIALEVQNMARETEFKLIETLADVIAARLVQNFPVRSAVVEVRKFVLPGAEYVSVATTRSAPE
jgi:dihydroneopterin aldolase